MEDLSAQRILDVWEQGTLVNAESRALALVSLVVPGVADDALADQVLGERNHYLLQLHQHLFGSMLQAYVECSACGEALDIEFAIDEFGFTALSPDPEIHLISLGSLSAQVRLPNSHDLMALASIGKVEDGRQVLFSRCVQSLQRGDATIGLSNLEESELDQLEQAISELDPRMEILFDLQCPQCAHVWQSPLEIDTFIWREYDSYVRQLLENIHVLAISYGWSESDILAMSQQRQQFYLQRILQ